MYHVMIIDDEPAICQSLTFALEDRYHVYAFTDPREALPLFERVDIAIVLLDLKIGEYNGIDVLEEIKRISPSTIVIIMTAYGSIPSSVEAMRKGAFSYATKPLHIDELEVLMQKAEEVYTLHSKVQWLSHELDKVTDNYGLIGKSAAMREIFTLIDKIKDIDSNVLITGESGTGKEVVARTIHYQSKRRNKKFQAINCAAIPGHLLESELFGYEKGAFTGAVQRKSGLFVLAEGGTIFLDEIGEMDLALQGKLLRVLQEKKVMPIGGIEEISIDVRIIAATNRNLEKEVKENRFREDLYYRLNVIPIQLPSLRERREDIPLLVEFFIKKYSDKMGKPVEGISQEALQLLQQYAFPGNIRELQNMIERAIALTGSSCIQKVDLPVEIRKNNRAFISDTLIPVYVGETMEEIEKRVILHNLAACNGNQRKTAQIIGIGERTLREKLKKYREEK
ncbi:sigma-54-dependent transcriptional regulator [Aneurinibacillus thermoaerophilus]|uniref:Sigma-54 dependent transcriptional regulator n=1 Tax=Aneurinibacillus thermoaerophilus TaxID=143495 RepID=A0ABX8YHZ4_ANETH|nr:sigma-54 dependent transcriptional regulator [Aneurinibacillus thermoaerophilus]MED0681007.1 sigma-54 dependent transcriptional regulator [Aneurinibacillus thermoaerophilus]MED0738577.1 sigma-54 dependent transcriptional regulator [Aneurinibacillus thermoaerophilus]MED0757758.1 sigma-54 dependent transcriptional regulator [Aneurinibacillus thermoaerophilus]MED0762555.1 sigma-54 dependent transcriptional regulator [Aneurinibacillus thermoaerophilus]MED0765707.1 sigma-54 dependent transcripti